MLNYSESINECSVIIESRFPKDVSTQACRLVVVHKRGDEYVCAYQNAGDTGWYWGCYGTLEYVTSVYIERVTRDVKRLTPSKKTG